VTSIFAKPILPSEPRILNESFEQELTDRYLMPALIGLERFFLKVRAEVDATLQPQQPIKLGKPYPLGQCLEITQAVQKRLKNINLSDLDDATTSGHLALLAFLSAGGSMRRIWGDLRGQFFQNAFQIGTLYVDVSNDTVVPTKPKVEILPFAKSQLTPVTDFQHFKRIAERYWQDRVFPNHVLPELAPYCPLLHINPAGQVRLYDPTKYMIAMTRSTGFQASEEVLREPAMPAELFALVAENLQSIKLKIARTPEQGRAEALNHCRIYRAKRWHKSDRQKDIMVNMAHGVNRRLAKVIIHIPSASSTQQAAKRKGAEALVSGQPQLPSTLPYAVVSKGRHADKRWQRQSSYHFAAHDAIAPLAVQELPQAMMAMPIGFIEL
jgi:hypothetical protein